MSDPGATVGSTKQKRSLFGGCCLAIVVLVTLFILVGIALGPITPSIRKAAESSQMQTARQIGLMLFAFANDNQGKYPDGKSSTEVFQQLLDGQYAVDPTIFYVPLAGKIAPSPGQKKLKPENVSWDVTGGADSASSDDLPLVFLTRYKVSYQPGGAAIPLDKPFPRFGWIETQTWYDWLLDRPTIGYGSSGGIAVAYKSNSAKFMILNSTTSPDGSITNFVPSDFTPDGKAYRQLTPDGVLP